MSYRENQKWAAIVVDGSVSDPWDTEIEVEAPDIFEALEKVKKEMESSEETPDYEIVAIYLLD